MLPPASRKRFLIVNLAVISIFPLIGVQLFRLTLWNQQALVQFAEHQHNLVIEIPAERGAILDRNMKELATNLKVPSIYAVPRIIPKRERQRLSGEVSRILGVDRAFVEGRLDRDKAFIWLKRRVSTKEADGIRALKNQALGITYELKRFYPHGELAANVIGFCNVDTSGVDGLELMHDKQMSGKTGFRYTKRDALGREVVAFEKKLIPPVNGAGLILTIDQYIQFVTEHALDESFTKWNAASAIAIVMDPKTGEILAMASRPTFDPNQLMDFPPETRRNRPITDIFEPGSVFKIVTVAGALNEGLVKTTDVFNCENGLWRARPKRVIHDVHPYGNLTLPEVLINSSNIGTVKVALRMGEDKLYDYVTRFGFGQKTGIDFPGEVNGILRPVSKWSKFSITSIPFGQEVAATALQMVRAISVIANGGNLVKPYLLKEVRDEEGVTLAKYEPALPQSVISPETAATMKEILERVVEEGTGKNAAIRGIRVGGKTGTSQKLEPTGGYSHRKFVGSFIGFAPAEDPKLAMIVSIDSPHPSYYGGTVAAPVFRDAIEQSLIYLGYIPDQTVAAAQDAAKKTGKKTLTKPLKSKPVPPKNLSRRPQAVSPRVR